VIHSNMHFLLQQALMHDGGTGHVVNVVASLRPPTSIANPLKNTM
jgi:hypothetical protein